VAILSLKDIHKQYAGHIALDGVSFDLQEGTIFGLLGPNGAGKSSLIRIITQITAPDSGKIYFKGREMVREDIFSLGYLPEERGLYKKMKVAEQLTYFAQLKGMDKKSATNITKQWLEEFQLQDWWDKKTETLSKGMQQKVQFIATIINNPSIIILDEPFSGFDPVNAELVKNKLLQLKKEGKTILLSTHRMENVEELCNELCLIHHAKIIESGLVQDIKQRHAENRYKITFNTDITSINFDSMPVNIISQTENELVYSFDSNTINSNEVISKALLFGNMIGYEKMLPTINDVFIKLVKN
jgi:ABC-2 type transport system ATP-binding protein